MKTFNYPDKATWPELCKRPVMNADQLTDQVQSILKEVKEQGDVAIKRLTMEFDRVNILNLRLTEKEIHAGADKVPQELKTAIKLARDNIYKFHKAQNKREEKIETMPGVQCWRKSIAIEKVGLYIPGGTAPLFSTILMLGIPAQIAGCKEVIMCTPPNEQGEVNAAILYTAQLVGIKKIYKVGGAQAIAAMSYGTESIPAVYKILGPGNQYVTKAKELVQQEGVAIDMPAGPSEVLVVADQTAKPAFVAADLLSQAEHGIDSQVMLLSDNQMLITDTFKEIAKQIQLLPRKDFAIQAIAKSKAVLLNSIDTCIEFSNSYAPEHLIVASELADNYLDKIVNAGSVFVGNYSCESAGDYASGTNHTLPTNSFAKNYSGVSLDSFVKKITFQKLSPEGLMNIGPAIETMAEAEELIAHKNAVSIRLKDLNS